VKIVLDTTILVRATERSSGLARELLMNIVAGEHTLLFSNEMLHELARVLRYPRLREFYGLTENLVFDYVMFLRRSSEIVTLDPLVSAPIGDVNDIIVMQTAIIGEADILCTNDEDFFENRACDYLSNRNRRSRRHHADASFALLMRDMQGSAHLRSRAFQAEPQDPLHQLPHLPDDEVRRRFREGLGLKAPRHAAGLHARVAGGAHVHRAIAHHRRALPRRARFVR